jgi:hypothetical protein
MPARCARPRGRCLQGRPPPPTRVVRAAVRVLGAGRGILPRDPATPAPPPAEPHPKTGHPRRRWGPGGLRQRLYGSPTTASRLLRAAPWALRAVRGILPRDRAVPAPPPAARCPPSTPPQRAPPPLPLPGSATRDWEPTARAGTTAAHAPGLGPYEVGESCGCAPRPAQATRVAAPPARLLPTPRHSPTLTSPTLVSSTGIWRLYNSGVCWRRGQRR